jgi:hypothetical protein
MEAGLFLEEPYVVISIRTPGKAHAKLKGNHRDVLYLAFDNEEKIEGLPVHKDVQLMTPQQAQIIWRFFSRYKSEAHTFVCHCEHGKHRSPSVAAALCQAAGQDASSFFQKYELNNYVYQLVLDASKGSKT